MLKKELFQWICSVLWQIFTQFSRRLQNAISFCCPLTLSLSIFLFQSSWMVLAFFENCHFPNWNNNCFMLCLFAFLAPFSLYVFCFMHQYNCTVGCHKTVAKLLKNMFITAWYSSVLSLFYLWTAFIECSHKILKAYKGAYVLRSSSMHWQFSLIFAFLYSVTHIWPSSSPPPLLLYE